MIIVLLKHVLKNYYDLYTINVIYLGVHDFLVLLRQYRQQMSFFLSCNYLIDVFVDISSFLPIDLSCALNKPMT